jgi:hypothetical protein
LSPQASLDIYNPRRSHNSDKADEERALRLPFSIDQSITTHDFQTRDRDCLTIDYLDNLTICQPHQAALKNIPRAH